MFSRSQTRFLPEQSRSDVQGEVPEQTFDRHERPAGQSPLALHSTHTPSVVLHTRPGHIRDDVHGTDITQAPAMQLLPDGQSAAAVQPALASSATIDWPHPAISESRTAPTGAMASRCIARRYAAFDRESRACNARGCSGGEHADALGEGCRLGVGIPPSGVAARKKDGDRVDPGRPRLSWG
jgi:hypothetical protein